MQRLFYGKNTNGVNVIIDLEDVFLVQDDTAGIKAVSSGSAIATVQHADVERFKEQLDKYKGE